jgi:hypothetical protein
MPFEHKEVQWKYIAGLLRALPYTVAQCVGLRHVENSDKKQSSGDCIPLRLFQLKQTRWLFKSKFHTGHRCRQQPNSNTMQTKFV